MSSNDNWTLLIPQARCSFLRDAMNSRQAHPENGSNILELTCEGKFHNDICFLDVPVGLNASFQCPYKKVRGIIKCDGDGTWRPSIEKAWQNQCYVKQDWFYWWQFAGLISLQVITVLVCGIWLCRVRKSLNSRRHNYAAIHRNLFFLHMLTCGVELTRKAIIRDYSTKWLCGVLHVSHYVSENTASCLLLGYGMYNRAIISWTSPSMAVVVRAVYFSCFMFAVFESMFFLFLDLIHDPHFYYLCHAQKHERYSFYSHCGCTTACVLLNLIFMLHLRQGIMRIVSERRRHFRSREFPPQYRYTTDEVVVSFNCYMRLTLVELGATSLTICGLVAVCLDRKFHNTQRALYTVYYCYFLRGVFHSLALGNVYMWKSKRKLNERYNSA